MKEPDNRMVRCVLDGHTSCPAKCPEACICYQMQCIYDAKYGTFYDRNYARKYGEEQS